MLSDAIAGFFVFLIALPLCLGISVASGFPPVAGIFTAIIGGCLCSFLGSSRLTIKGPAAGLIVIAMGCVQELGMGAPILGYRRALAVGVIAALVQIGFSFCGAATLGVAMSPSVVHGMLAAIGVIIVSKQSHVLLGVTPEGEKPLELLLEIPHSMARANPEILVLGMISLIILFGLPLVKNVRLRKIPSPLLVIVCTVPLGMYFDLSRSHAYFFNGMNYSVGPEFLIQLPGSLLDAIAHPDFSVITSGASVRYIFLFALIGSIESVLSVIAVDSMDPEKRTSDLNKDLFAVGVGNLLSSSIGGLPMISEIVRSKANIDAGATSKYANVTHGVFLLAFVALVPGLLSQIPLAALAAMLIYTGLRLASPAQFRHAHQAGTDQLILFLATFITTLATDLLIGISIGIILKMIQHVFRGVRVKSLFSAEIEKKVQKDRLYLAVSDCAVFTNFLKIRREILTAEKCIKHIRLDLSQARLVDHTFLTRILELSRELQGITFEVTGLESLVPASSHPQATHRGREQ